MPCIHQFILITQVEKASSKVVPGIMSRFDSVGAKCGCIICGEIRTIWDNGEIEYNVISQKAHDNYPNTDNSTTSGIGQ